MEFKRLIILYENVSKFYVKLVPQTRWECQNHNIKSEVIYMFTNLWDG